MLCRIRAETPGAADCSARQSISYFTFLYLWDRVNNIHSRLLFVRIKGRRFFSWPVAEKHHSRSDGSVFGRGVSMSSIDVHIQEIADNPKYVRESNPICPTAAAGSNMFNSTLHGALYVLLRVIF